MSLQISDIPVIVEIDYFLRRAIVRLPIFKLGMYRFSLSMH